jgi:hypothetical protein
LIELKAFIIAQVFILINEVVLSNFMSADEFLWRFDKVFFFIFTVLLVSILCSCFKVLIGLFGLCILKIRFPFILLF